MENIFKYRTLFTLPKFVDNFAPFAFHTNERTVTRHKGCEKIYSAHRKISDIGDSLNPTDDDDIGPIEQMECDCNLIGSSIVKCNSKGETRWIE